MNRDNNLKTSEDMHSVYRNIAYLHSAESALIAR